MSDVPAVVPEPPPEGPSPLSEEDAAEQIGRMRALSRRIAAAELHRRIDAVGRFGVVRSLDEDPLGRVVSGHRDPHGIDWICRTGPIGVVALVRGDREVVADCLLAGNGCVFPDEDDSELRNGLSRAGFPSEVVTRFTPLPSVEIDALWRGADDDMVVAERVGGHRHIYVDADANEHHVAYVCTNAASHGSADTVVFHRDYPAQAAADVRSAIETMGRPMEMLTVGSAMEACEVVDARSGGEVETVMSTNLAVMREFLRYVDAAAVVVNCSPAFVEADHLRRELVGFTRTRWELHGDGQTKPLGTLLAP